MNIFSGRNNGSVNININGRNINVSGNHNVVINNGQVLINGKPFVNESMGKIKSFDKTEKLEDNLKSVIVSAQTTNVTVVNGDENKVQYIGGYYGDKEPAMELSLWEDNNLRITVDRHDIMTENCNLIITLKDCDNIHLRNVSGNVVVKDFDVNIAKLHAVSGDIHFDGSVKSFEADSTSGDINFYGYFEVAEAETTSGDIEISVRNEGNCTLTANSMSGDIGVMTEKFEAVNIEMSSMSGRTKNRINPNYVTENAFTATLQTMSGDICVDEL